MFSIHYVRHKYYLLVFYLTNLIMLKNILILKPSFLGFEINLEFSNESLALIN